VERFPDYYPRRPIDVPKGLTRPSLRYRRHLNLVRFALALFFITYAAIIVFFLVLAGSQTVKAARMAVHGVLGLVVFHSIFALLLIVPIVFLVKSLFAAAPIRKGSEIEVFPDEHPRLFEFIECVCDEVDAPMPQRVLVNCEVNAAAGSPVSLMSLVREPERELILGLPLINALNMTEFKALLAHELGHLSQHDMPSGPYVRLGMMVVGNILSQYQALEWLFILVVKLSLQLAREMEFHADLTAVSVTGSDAPAHLLYKSLWADHCMQQTISDLERAREHELYSTDIFVHHALAGKHLRQRRKDPTLGSPPILPADRRQTAQLFRPDDDEQAAMWNDHPSNYERELNCKARYVRTDFVKQSPWSLFDDVADLRRRASAAFYKEVFRAKKSVRYSDAKTVQAFLEEEFAETNFNFDRYGVLYNHRNLQPIDFKGIVAISGQQRNDPTALVRSHRLLYTQAVKAFGDVQLRHLSEIRFLDAVDNEWVRPKDGRFSLRGRKFKRKMARKLIKELDAEIARDNKWLAKFDACVFATYYELALWIDASRAEELVRRYRFHFVLQNLWTKLREHEGPMNFIFDALANLRGQNLDEASFHMVIEVFRKAYDAVKYVLEQSELAKFPELVNMPAGHPVRPYLLKGELPSKPTHFDIGIRVKWMVKFSDKYREVQRRLDRLHFKSLGAILAMQEALGEEAAKRWDG
jgi:Zn-dependent protease with chaperone function